MSPATVAITLALLLGLQPVATDLYLPALPLLKADLGTDMSAAQRTLAALILAFGLGQLLCGPLADRYGRRPVLLGGLAVYCLASVAAVMAPTIDTLIGCRALQGLGVAASVVCGRAMVRDLYEPRDGVRVLSQGMTGLALIALIGPPVAAGLAQAAGWRAALAVLAGFGMLSLLWLAWRLRETLATPDPLALQPARLLQTWRHILGNRTFRSYAALTACTYGGLYTYLAASSFVLIEQMGWSRLAYSLSLSAGATGYMVGTFGCRYWLHRHGIRGTVARGGVLAVTGGLVCGGLSVAGLHHPLAIVLPQLLYACAHGVFQSCGQAGVTGPFPRQAGAASALSGFILCAVAFAVGQSLGPLMDAAGRTPYPLTLGLAAWSVITATLAWTAVQRHGEPPAAQAVTATSRRS